MTRSAAIALREPWESLDRQREAASFGMWIFLGSELLFFGGLFLGYAVYRTLHPQAFLEAARETNLVYGTLNTAILLTSSLTMVVAERAAHGRLRRLALRCLAATMALGVAFMIVKGFEYAEDIREGLLPGFGFRLEPPATALFFAFYWIMTGLHAIHLTIGVGAVARLLLQSVLGSLPLEESSAVPATALYWHLIDVIWIFLYPVLYLVGRA